MGTRTSSNQQYDETIKDYLRPVFQQFYTMSFENYPGGREPRSRDETRGESSMISLSLKEQPTVPLEAECISPDVIGDL